MVGPAVRERFRDTEVLVGRGDVPRDHTTLVEQVRLLEEGKSARMRAEIAEGRRTSGWYLM